MWAPAFSGAGVSLGPAPDKWYCALVIDCQPIIAQAVVQFPEAPTGVLPAQRPQCLLHGLVVALVRHRVVAIMREPNQGTRPALAPAFTH